MLLRAADDGRGVAYRERATGAGADPLHHQSRRGRLVAGARGGSGVWQQVAMDEYMSAGFDGENGMLGTPPSLRDASVKIPGVGGATAATCRYSSITLAWTSESSELVGISKGKGSVNSSLNVAVKRFAK